MNKKGVSTLKVAATYIGTVVGAGFATGQELLQFFSKFGAMGLAGLLISALMFILFGYIIMDLGKKLNARSHVEIILYSSGNQIGKVIDYIITIFLFGSFSAMIAGTGALFTQQLNLPGVVGNILMAVLTALTVLTGINGVINSISFVVPFLLAAVIGTSVFSIINTPPDIAHAAINTGRNVLMNNWFLASVLYVSYNIILSIAVLGPLGASAQNKKAIRNGSILGGLGLGMGSVMIYFALSGSASEIAGLEVPMIYVAGKISYFAQIIYALVLTAEVYTTSVGALYGFAARITDIQTNPFKGRIVVATSTVAALMASQFGFSNLVKYWYPVEGYCGIILLVCLAYTTFSK
ncbi:YkvI family membrane protein [Sedimentibacter saalensis]|uniref:YkvI family membrane protein n=1 Tax=Sedimentibacter saalensis TaxID=130788 RepID=UPI0028A25E49|nr:hypothetical protein [Sedimentibacter saalensis]